MPAPRQAVTSIGGSRLSNAKTRLDTTQRMDRKTSNPPAGLKQEQPYAIPLNISG